MSLVVLGPGGSTAHFSARLLRLGESQPRRLLWTVPLQAADFSRRYLHPGTTSVIVVSLLCFWIVVSAAFDEVRDRVAKVTFPGSDYAFEAPRKRPCLE